MNNWTQGITETKDLPEALVEILSRKEPEGTLECVRWFPGETSFTAHYYKDGQFWKTREFKWQ